ncbi:glycosyltransferase family 61 protein [Pontibacter diazotrophicus]|uniref:Glycosyltransferase family 61 protein n=1 Tax=Pontibacter diazotrophicus TaxID=1400979 RepID=A0A3D8L8L3_9BACT|nr:glycosyltransferase family 61 protein [Pontibacter diazotrophicus]RDV13697.1 glycosyltransferase family 61 protein [Pontibacter diazotrophicus]
MKAYYDKGTRRLKRILGKIVPYNTHYRPSNICRINLEDFSASNPRELCIHPIYPALTTSLDISEDLYEACSEYWKPKKEVQTDYMVVEVPNGRIYTDNISSVAVVSQYNHLVENVSLSLMSGKVSVPNLNNIFEQRYFNPPVKLQGTVFSLLTGGAGINNISHWFVDVLPRLHLLRESGLYDKVDWFYVPSTRYSYQTETLELLGIPADKIISGETHPHIAADCVIASTAPRGNHTLVPQWLCDFIQSSFMPYAEKESDMLVPESPYLYISRSDSKMRNVLNEKELLQVLEPYGFRCVVASQLSIKEKIKLFSKAKVIMGATGAGLISMFFCKPGTKMVELFNEGFVIEPFYDIASKIGLDYEYIICKGSKRVRNASQGQRENLQVEIEKVVEILEMMRAKQEKKYEVA